jgi:hypothetical protein
MFFDEAQWLYADLVHGSVQQEGGPRFDHAWLEYREEREVWEPATNEIYSVKEFNRLFHPQIHRRYNYEEASEKVDTTGHSGPWDDEQEPHKATEKASPRKVGGKMRAKKVR